MQVCKWGNSLAVRIPASLVATLNLQEGDNIELVHTGRSLEVIKTDSREVLISALAQFKGCLPADYRFNRDDANER